MKYIHSFTKSFGQNIKFLVKSFSFVFATVSVVFVFFLEGKYSQTLIFRIQVKKESIMEQFNKVYERINSSRNFIRRELAKSGSSGKEYWRGFTPTEEIVDDIIQDSLIEAWRRWGEFDPDRSSLSTWVGWIIRGRVLNWKKYYSRRPQTDTTDFSQLTTIDQPDSYLESEQSFGGLDDYDHALIDFCSGGMSNEEIASILGTSESNVRHKIRNIKSKISHGHEGSQRDSPQGGDQ